MHALINLIKEHLILEGLILPSMREFSETESSLKVMKFLKHLKRVFMWQLCTQLFASSYIWLAHFFEASYSTVVTSVSKKSSVDQSELEK